MKSFLIVALFLTLVLSGCLEEGNKQDSFDEGFKVGREEGLEKGFKMCDTFDLNTADHKLLRDGVEPTGLWCYYTPKEGSLENYANSLGYDFNFVSFPNGSEYSEYYIVTKSKSESMPYIDSNVNLGGSQIDLNAGTAKLTSNQSNFLFIGGVLNMYCSEGIRIHNWSNVIVEEDENYYEIFSGKLSQIIYTKLRKDQWVFDEENCFNPIEGVSS